MSRLPLLWLTLVLAPLAAQPTAALGPRVTLEGDAIPLAEALDSLSRQLNRRLVSPRVRTRATAQQPYAFHLRDATAAETFRALEETLGCRVRRASRTVYSLVDSTTPLIGQVGQPFGDFRVWLTYVRYTFYSYLYLGADDRRYAQAVITPSFSLEAPSDPEALRIRALGPPTGVTADGQELRAAAGRGTVNQPDPNDPRCWTLAQSLLSPSSAIRELAQVWFDVTFAREVAELRYDFPLTTRSSQLQTDGDVDARLESRRQSSDWRRGLGVTFVGAVPPDLEGPQLDSQIQRTLWVEGQYTTAAGRRLLTEARQEGFQATGELWQAQWRFALSDVDAREEPARLEVRLYQAGPPGETERFTFEHIPLPPRSDDPPPE